MIAVRPSDPNDADRLLQIWRDAVASSHGFLAIDDRVMIEQLVAQYVSESPLLVATLDRNPVGFMGVSGINIDSLFVDPAVQGKGIGRFLTDRVGSPATVDVNEQNELAVGFYGHLGFKVTGRSALDDQGRPYPLLHMRRG